MSCYTDIETRKTWNSECWPCEPGHWYFIHSLVITREGRRGFSDVDMGVGWGHCGFFCDSRKECVSGPCCPCDDQSFNLRALYTSRYLRIVAWSLFCDKFGYVMLINFWPLRFWKKFKSLPPGGEQIMPRKGNVPSNLCSKIRHSSWLFCSTFVIAALLQVFAILRIDLKDLVNSSCF